MFTGAKSQQQLMSNPSRWTAKPAGFHCGRLALIERQAIHRYAVVTSHNQFVQVRFNRHAPLEREAPSIAGAAQQALHRACSDLLPNPEKVGHQRRQSLLAQRIVVEQVQHEFARLFGVSHSRLQATRYICLRPSST